MDKLVEKMSGLSYELFGILIPGMICFLLMFYHVSLVQWMGGAHWHETYFYKTLSSSLLLETSFRTIAVILTIYLLGQLVNQSAEMLIKDSFNGMKKIMVKLLIFPALPCKLNKFKDKDAFDAAKKSLADLGIKNNSEDWFKFYGPASRLIFQLGLRSRVSTYQNKYTLHRSLLFLFATSSRVSGFTIVGYLGYIFISGEPLSFLKLISFGVSLLTAAFLSWMFLKTFERFWTLWGDQVCWEVQGLSFCKKEELLGKIRNE